VDPTLFVGTFDFSMEKLRMTTESDTNLPVLSGGTLCPATLFDGQTHFGVAVAVKADGKESYLMIPDATNITKGQPVYITKPVSLEGQHLATYLKKKNVSMPVEVMNLLKATSISCNAFYFSKNERALTQEEITGWATKNPGVTKPDDNKVDEGALLMMFEVDFKGGLMGALTGDPDLENLFTISGASLRVLRCRDSSKEILEKYVELLGEK